MPIDYRMDAAQYYDMFHAWTHDIPFYLQRMTGPSARVLELGCGTGRLMVLLAERCTYIHGIDCSEAALTLCREKLHAANIPASSAVVEVGDVADFNLEMIFDWIIAPCRVMQNLATDAEVDGFLRGITRHLAPGGTCILNVFKPSAPPEQLQASWRREEERVDDEMSIAGGRVVCSSRQPHMTLHPLVLYPELVYRRYEENALVGEAVLKFPMRCYYPDEFLTLIEGHGFQVTGKWGGYAGEPYGDGGELVVAFTKGAAL